VLFGAFGPMGVLVVVPRLRHLATVFEFRP